VADPTVIHTGENSPEYIAFRLLYEIANAERKGLERNGVSDKADRAWILDTYGECLTAVRGTRRRGAA
jgi:hypothetical protein